MEQTDVIDAVAHHNKSVKTDVYIEARIFVGVKSCRTKNIGVGRTAGHYFYPANVLTNAAALSAANQTAHIYLKSGLDEGEESCSHTNGNILSEHL